MRYEAKELFTDWYERQGRGIKEARPMAVFAACVSEAKDRCNNAPNDYAPRVLLSAADITKCEERALSSARVAKFGPPPRAEETWRDQIAQVRAEMYATPAANQEAAHDHPD
jgi:hypothetical protein